MRVVGRAHRVKEQLPLRGLPEEIREIALEEPEPRRAASTILVGDCRAMLRTLEEQSVQTCITSPPYWGLRCYDVDGQIGLEKSFDEFVETLVEVFREVRRVLRDDGTLWVNLGDTYAGQAAGYQGKTGQRANRRQVAKTNHSKHGNGLKRKDLVGAPWAVAFALRADGWFLRSEIIWAKPNAKPDSAGDRPSRMHETIFLLSKKPRYFYDADAIRTPLRPKTATTYTSQRRSKGTDALGRVASDNFARDMPNRAPRLGADGKPAGANKRTVWTVATRPFAGAHFATFPEALIEPCILAGSREGDVVLDPFSGAGTTGVGAVRRGRDYIGIELNPEYAEASRRRIDSTR